VLQCFFKQLLALPSDMRLAEPPLKVSSTVPLFLAAGSIAELCKDPAAQAWLLAELQATGKENKTKVRLVTLLQPSLHSCCVAL
jgi:hypothetical protein